MSRLNFARGVFVVLLALSGSCGAGGKVDYDCDAGTSVSNIFLYGVSVQADTIVNAEDACANKSDVKAAAKAAGATSFGCSCSPVIIGSPTAPSRR